MLHYLKQPRFIALLSVPALLGLIIYLGMGGALSGLTADPASPGKGQGLAPKFSLNDPLLNLAKASQKGTADAALPIDKVQLKENYLDWAQYPPNSRPLEESHVDVIEHRTVRLTDQKMPFFDGQTYRESGFSCQLQPENHTVTAQESMRIFLTCRGAEDSSNRILSIDSFSIEGRAGEFTFQPQKPEYGDNGRNGDETSGDGVVTFLFEPDVDDWGDIYLTVNFQIKGDSTGSTYSMRTHFFSSPTAPAVFSQIVGEEIRDGSLYIQVELNVERPGRYTLAANLFAQMQPVAFARAEQVLQTGTQRVEFEFFGKIFRDKNLPGPYTLSGLRGSLHTGAVTMEMLSLPPEQVAELLQNVKDNRPSRMFMPYFTETYQTEDYPVLTFSDAEYASAQKEERLALIDSLPQ